MALLVTTGGLVASGKSTLARALAERLGARCIVADRVRAHLRPDDAAFDEERVYAELFQEAEAALAAHPDLYEERDGAVVLAIRNGQLQMSSIQSVGYGYDLGLRVDERVPASRWVEQQI